MQWFAKFNYNYAIVRHTWARDLSRQNPDGRQKKTLHNKNMQKFLVPKQNFYFYLLRKMFIGKFVLLRNISR